MRPVVREQHLGREMTRVHVDRVAKENELEQRNGHHHGEGEAVAAHLDELLHDHALETLEGKLGQPVHEPKLSFDFSMSWMKTSSRPEGIRFHS